MNARTRWALSVTPEMVEEQRQYLVRVRERAERQAELEAEFPYAVRVHFPEDHTTLVVDDIKDWCWTNCRGRFTTLMAIALEKDGFSIQPRFERQEDAALFKIFWG